jgi:cobalt-zinc-cadmium efflux system outer membrane protein
MEVLEKEWLWRQTKAWPNPGVEIELENFGGRLLDVEEEPAELTAAVSQLLELGGKRGKKKRMARFAWDLAKNDAEGLRLDVLQAAGEGFITLLAAQELERHAVEFSQQGRKMYLLVKARVEVGKISPLILKKAGVLLADADIALNKARRRRQDARHRLAVLWRETDASFERAVGSLSKRYLLPSGKELWERVKKAPETLRQQVTEGLNKTAVKREKAAVIPDIEITGGLRKLRHVQGHRWVAAASFQLPLFDWNRGNIKAAKYHLQKSNARSKDFMNRLRVEFREIYRQWTSAGEEAQILETKSLAVLEQLYDDTLEGYKAGKFSFLEVLEARQTLIRTKQRYVRVLHKFHLAALKLARMAGATLGQLLAGEQPFE